MGEWLKYYQNDKNSKRYLNDVTEKVNRRYNVISFEYSKTHLNYKRDRSIGVAAPKVMRDMNWANHWPEKDKQGRTTYDTNKEPPSFMNYCLMGTKDSYTEWHIDLGGTSVWYHIHRGKKIFIMVEPTKETLQHYKNWENQEEKSKVCWRQGFIEYCQSLNYDCKPKILTLVRGSTVLIPSGYIHCVYTPEDSVVFGGNCLHDYNVKKQLEMIKLENDITGMKKEYRLNCFVQLCWYAARDLRRRLDAANEKRMKNYAEVYITALEELSKFLKTHKNLKQAPHDIAPKRLINKIKESIQLRRNYQNQNAWNVDNTRLPEIDASEIGTETDMKIPDSIRCYDPSYRAPVKKEPVKEEVPDDDYEPDAETFEAHDDFQSASGSSSDSIGTDDESVSDSPDSDDSENYVPKKKKAKTKPVAKKKSKKNGFRTNNKAQKIYKRSKEIR